MRALLPIIGLAFTIASLSTAQANLGLAIGLAIIGMFFLFGGSSENKSK